MCSGLNGPLNPVCVYAQRWQSYRDGSASNPDGFMPRRNMRRVSPDVRGLIDLGPEFKANCPGQGVEDFAGFTGRSGASLGRGQGLKFWPPSLVSAADAPAGV